MDLLLQYFITINIITFMLFAIDKWKAKKNRWRIRESVLLGASFIGGAMGGLLSMRVCRHKTQKKRFSIGIPMMLVLHLLIVVFILVK